MGLPWSSFRHSGGSVPFAASPATGYVVDQWKVNAAVVLSTCYTGLHGRDLTVRSTGNPSISTPTALCP